MTIHATREKLTLPSDPVVGVPFSTKLKLTDVDGNLLGDGSAHAMIVDITSEPDPTPTCHASIVLRLPDGELHLQCHVDFFAPSKIQRGAIIGGTEDHANAAGHFDRITPTFDSVILKLSFTTPGQPES